MRKQTKIVAVASAAAVLAIGASMTSFAATGWVEEDGVWYYYNKDGNRVDDEWKKSGDYWYWLDSEENGAMAVDKLIEDGDDTYYCDSNGQMVRNTWVKVVNEDQDDDDDPAEYNYYYMQSSGKAYKSGDNNTKFRTIDGKKYAFDDDGKMLYGWVDTSNNRLTGEDDWAGTDEMYYCGNWDDGAMKTGWQLIYVHDEEEDDDMEHWFYFKSNGKKRAAESSSEIEEKTINGKKYGFDERGVMVYQWTLVATANTATAASSWKYFSSPEDGARKTKGWFKVVAPNEDNVFKAGNDYDNNDSFASEDGKDEEERWYYADGDGKLAEGEIRKIKGKYYGFRPDDDGEGKGAAMLSGLVLISVDADGKIDYVYDDGVDSDELDDIIDGSFKYNKTTEWMNDSNASLYYFGNNEDTDGAMKTGSVSITLDGDSYNFLFSKSGGAEGKGRGQTGIDDDKYVYKYGVRLKADSDDKYLLVKVEGEKTISDSNVNVEKMSNEDMRNLRSDAEEAGKNKDNEMVRVSAKFSTEYRLVNTSGTIVKNKTAAKDGADWYFYVKNYNIRMYTNNKTLKGNNNTTLTCSKGNLEDWDSTDTTKWTQ